MTKSNELEVKVTRIKNRWHARLIQDDKLLDEMACQCRQDIGYICRQMMRWFNKTGGVSQYAKKARDRMYKPDNRGPVRKIW